MSTNADAVRMLLANGPRTARQLIELTGISQPTLSRTMAGLGNEVVRLGAARSIQYALHDTRRGLPDIPVYRVDAEGRIQPLGILSPVRPDGYVMRQADGATHHSDGLPWWLHDMRPQGYLGRAWANRHGNRLGLPGRLNEWSDSDAIKALLDHGHDPVGNLLLGDTAREHFLTRPASTPIARQDKPETYVSLARQAAIGELPGSSAGGEQPKFTTWAETPDGPRQLIVKFSEPDAGPVGERWRDLLLAEHLALDTLRAAGIGAARSWILDHDGQRFLEVERFDRIGELGRHALYSLAALDAEFVGAGASPWPAVARALASQGHIQPEAANGAALLWAFGTLIGNTDMHHGNLSFISPAGRPYALAPAYDMTPMAFAPRSGGGLPDSLPEARLDASVDNQTWRDAAHLARLFLDRIQSESRFSERFQACIGTLVRHLDIAAGGIERLGY